MSKRKKRSPSDESMAATGAEGQAVEETTALDAPPASPEDASAEEPTGFEKESPTPASLFGPLASFEEIDGAIEAVLGEAALNSEAPLVLAESEVLPVIDPDWRAGAIVDMVVGDEGSGGSGGERWEEPTRVGEQREMAELAAQSAEPGAAAEDEHPPVDSWARLENIIESLIFAADKPLGVADLKRLTNERDGKKVQQALEALQARHRGTGVELASTAGGWQFRTNPENAVWVAKLIAGRPARLSRAMLETLAIVAYRQPITRPEIDEIRGVDCGPVLKTLLDRGLIRMIGKKEEVGRPILYGTTPEFLRTFSLKDLTELPTLRQFHELGAAEQARVDAEAPPSGADAGGVGAGAQASAPLRPQATSLPDHDPAEEDALLSELDEATSAATRAASVSEHAPAPVEPEPETAPPPAPETARAAAEPTSGETSAETSSDRSSEASGDSAGSADDATAAAALAAHTGDAESPGGATDTTRPPTSE
jgi:segregation and condensation protein B